MSISFRSIDRLVRAYPLVWLSGLFVLLVVAYLLCPVEEQRQALAPQGEGDRVYFGDNVTVAQEFQAEAGLVKITIPLGRTAPLPGPLLLHIRPAHSDEDITVVPIFSLQDELAVFKFNPLRSVPRQAKWVLEAPHSPGNSFWVYREQDSSIFSEGRAFVNGRVHRGNFAFAQIWARPTIVSSQSLFEVPQVSSWERVAVWIGLLAGLAWLFIGAEREKLFARERLMLGLVLGAGFCLHLFFSTTMLIVNDEGAYIQDVLQASSHLLPFRDYLTKGPAYLLLLWLWQFLIPNTIIAWRLFSAVSWVLAGIGLWLFMRQWGMSAKTRLIASAAFSLMPAAVSLTVPILLQVTSVPVALFGLWLVLRGVHMRSTRLVGMAAAIMAIGFFIRVSTVIPALMGLVLIVWLAKDRIRQVLVYVGTGVLIFAIVFGSGVAVMGLSKAAILVNAEALLISQNRQEKIQAKSDKEPIIRTAVIEARVLWRAGLPYLVAVLLSPLLFMARRTFYRTALLALAGLYIVWHVWFTLADTGYLLPGNYYLLRYIIFASVVVLPILFLVILLLYQRSKTVVTRERSLAVFLLVWLLLTGVLYGQWGRFRQSYWVEFLPALSILVGIMIPFVASLWNSVRPVWLKRAGAAMATIVVAVWICQAYVIAWKYPHTGTVSPVSLHRMVKIVSDAVPRGTTLFTAQPILTAAAERPIMFGYSHPGWYRESRVGSLPAAVRDLLFISPEGITAYLEKEAEYVFFDHRTDEIYFDGYPQRRTILDTLFSEVGSVQNEGDGDTFILYKRK